MRTLTKAAVVDVHPGDFARMDQSIQFGSTEDADTQLNETFGVVRPRLLDVLDMTDYSPWRHGPTNLQSSVCDITATANDSDFYQTGSTMLIDFNHLSLETGNDHGLATIAYGKSGLCTTASAFMQDLANIFGPITIDSEGTFLFSNPTTSDQLRITALEDAEVELLQCQLQEKASEPYISFNCDHLTN